MKKCPRGEVFLGIMLYIIVGLFVAGGIYSCLAYPEFWADDQYTSHEVGFPYNIFDGSYGK